MRNGGAFRWGNDITKYYVLLSIIKNFKRQIYVEGRMDDWPQILLVWLKD